MIKSELIKAIAGRMPHLPERTVEKAANLILAHMSQALVNGKRIEIRDFGIFSVRTMPGRAAHNPRTGKKVAAPPKNKVHFRPGLKLRQRLIKSQNLVAIEKQP